MAKKTTPAPDPTIEEMFNMEPAKTEKEPILPAEDPTPDETLPILPPAELPAGETHVDPDSIPPHTHVSDAERMDAVLGATEFRTSESLVEKIRADLKNIPPELHISLAVEINEILGKAAGHLPDFNNMTENMKGAYLRAVGHVWMACQRHVRTYNE
jgi:hypothetical protein